MFRKVVHWFCFALTLYVQLASAEKKTIPYVEINPTSQSSLLRKALYGGSPYLLFCKTNDAATGQAQFIQQVRDKVAETDTESDLHTAVVDCEAPVGGKGKSLKDVLKLGKIKDTVTIIWCVNGAKPQRLDHKYYATIMKDKGGSANGQARLNPSKLAKYAVKYGAPQVLKLKSNATFKSDCAGSKHQTCAVALHMGTLKTAPTNAIKRIAKLFRSVKVYTLDVAQFDFSILDKMPKVSPDAPQLVVLKRRNAEVSSELHQLSHKAIIDPVPELDDTCEEAPDVASAEECDNSDFFESRHIVSMSKSLSAMAKLKAGTSHDEIHAVFGSGLVDTKREILEDNFKLVHSGNKDLVFKISVKSLPDVHDVSGHPRVAYFLDWHAMQPYLVSQTVFSKGLTVPKIAALQQDTWSRVHRSRVSKAKKSQAVSARAFRGDLSNRKEVRSFFDQLVSGDLSLAPISKVPSIKSKASSSTKASTKPRKASKGTSKKKTTKPKSRKKTTSEPSRSAEQIELERQQRMEMDKEAQQFFAEYTGDEVDAEDSNTETISPEDEEVLDLDEFEEEDVIDLDDDEDVIDLDDDDDDLGIDEDGEI